MKRNLMTLVLALGTWMGLSAMDYETARERAYYLTDKMAYELNLNDQQYNDAYEINLDYLLSLNTEADLMDGRYLAYRNDDLRHILYDWQWTAFAAVDYLFRPVWWLSGGWYFPVFRHYAHGYYFYHRPTIFWDYRGGHGRFYFSTGFYHNRRPMWHGGLRGMHRSMIGHPNGHGGHRYGEPGGGRGGFRPERNGGRSFGRNRNDNFRPEGNGNRHDGQMNGQQRPEGQMNGNTRSGNTNRDTYTRGGRTEGYRSDGSRLGNRGGSLGELNNRGSRSTTSDMRSSSRTTVRSGNYTTPSTSRSNSGSMRSSGSSMRSSSSSMRSSGSMPSRSSSFSSTPSRSSGSSFGGSSRGGSMSSGRSGGGFSGGGSRGGGGASRGGGRR